MGICDPKKKIQTKAKSDPTWKLIKDLRQVFAPLHTIFIPSFLFLPSPFFLRATLSRPEPLAKSDRQFVTCFLYRLTPKERDLFSPAAFPTRCSNDLSPSSSLSYWNGPWASRRLLSGFQMDCCFRRYSNELSICLNSLRFCLPRRHAFKLSASAFK